MAEQHKSLMSDESEDLENLLTVDDSLFEDGSEQKDEKIKVQTEFQEVDQSKHINNCMRVLRFLQLLCENHHNGLQNFLREQTMENGQINAKSFDFVSYVSGMLGIYEKSYVNCYSCQLGNQIIDTLTELIQGPCKEN